ncbi:YkvA family protein [Lysinibacillus piscis]|uniref:DUF1232 domain-containing protein n=1 Tax=Lysinibacillus piscis TaxID=2518931 RepID=A0ABQ5NLL3_9BACI|nr:DUF1232 domain-containing protein [Lysinibacillus sp. KH24]GLC88987.1 hypothetical protein LYSBPC_21140 [Lysinibacillus sp. KH24]
MVEKRQESIDNEIMQQHDTHYSEDKLWAKIKKYAKKAGSSVVYAVLILYFVLQKEEVPKKDKVIIIGALGYFIFPFDLIPDMAVGVGYADDIGALVAALVRVAMYIDEDIKQQAKAKLTDWFGEDVDTSDIDDQLV